VRALKAGDRKRTQSLIDAMREIGADRILFSTDWPFENIDHAAEWFDRASISEDDRARIGRTNAISSQAQPRDIAMTEYNRTGSDLPRKVTTPRDSTRSAGTISRTAS
jgi:hypothetical protein